MLHPGAALAGAVLVGAALVGAALAAPAAPFPSAGFHRGAVLSSWDGTYPDPQFYEPALDRMIARGVTWVEMLTFAEQPDLARPEIRAEAPDRFPHAAIEAAHRRGLKVLLKPDVWSRQFYAPGSTLWRGSIRYDDAALWGRWFEQYGAFIRAQAQAAAESHVEMFSVGLEYVEATRTQTARWRALIADVRSVYKGTLTYAADGNHELDTVQFWDALDVIGINGYFALSPVGDSPDVDTLVHAWGGPFSRLAELSRRFARPVVFTEAGFPSTTTAVRTPWKWPTGADTPDPGLQARAYESLLIACSRASFCQGLYWWKFYERPEAGTPPAVDYTPEGKPADAVLTRWYREGPPPSTPTPLGSSSREPGRP